MNWDAFLEASRRETNMTSQKEQEYTTPHIVNLNEDSMLSGVIKHYLNKTETMVGKEAGIAIKIPGLSIADKHAIITIHDDTRVTIRPATPGARTKVNGDHIRAEVELKHHDRIVFGSNHFYYFVHPGAPSEPDTPLIVSYYVYYYPIPYSLKFSRLCFTTLFFNFCAVSVHESLRSVKM